MVEVNDEIDKTKGKSDDKTYRFITLDNGLESLLISTKFSKSSRKTKIHPTIINDRRISVRHNSISLVKTSTAQGLLLGNEQNEIFSVKNQSNVVENGPPAVPNRPKPRRRVSTTKIVNSTSNRRSVGIRNSTRESHLKLNPSNLSRISLFSELKPLTRVSKKVSHSSINANKKLSEFEVNRLSFNKKKQENKLKNSRKFVNSKSITIPGNTILNLDNSSNIDETRVKMASVSLSVCVGSFAESSKFNGLAHFLEHLLFMGTEKYPKENHFDEFLNRFGGSSNAYTDSERTVFHFNCPEQNLKEALKIFSNFFKKPLFLQESGLRELESIEEEFKLRKNDDECRILELWRYTSRKSTPFSKFTCGNKSTLKPKQREKKTDENEQEEEEEEVFKELKLFFEKYYISENIKLVIEASEEIENLQNYVNLFFKDIRSGKQQKNSIIHPTFKQFGIPWRIGIPRVVRRLLRECTLEVWEELVKYDKNRPEIEVIKPGFDGASLGCIFRTIPLQDLHKLTMIWQLPPQNSKIESRPTDYIISLLGHNCQGSVFAEARRRGWVTSLTVTCCTTDGFEDNSVCSLLKVNIVLTRSGFEQWTYVAGMVFQYISMLNREDLQEWVFKESIKIYKASYDYTEETDVQTRVQELSVCMLPQWKYTPLNLLDMGLFNDLRWSPKEIRKILNLLRPELVRIDLSSTVFQPKTKDKDKDNYYNYNYEEDSSVNGNVHVQQPIPKEQQQPIPKEKLFGFSTLRKKITKRSSKTKLKEKEKEKVEVEDKDECSIMNKEIKRYGLTEPFTEMMFWCDRVPSQVMSMWVELLEGTSTVIAGVDEIQLGTKSDLIYPPRNNYIAEDFEIKCHFRKKQEKSDLESYLLWKEIEIKHGAITDPSPKTIIEKETITNSYKLAKILYVDEKNMRIIVKYENDLLKWHYLEENFYILYQKQIEQQVNERISTLSIEETKKKIIKQPIKLDNLLQSRLILSNQRLFQSKKKRTELLSEEHIKYQHLFPKISTKQLKKIPILLNKSNSLLSMWHFQDKSYNYPRAEIRCRILNPLSNTNAQNAALNDLLSLVVNEALRGEIYLAQTAELEVNITSFEHGQEISIFGFSHKLSKIFITVFSMFVQFATCGSNLADLTNELEALGKTKHGRRYKGHEEKLRKLEYKTLEELYKIIEQSVVYAQIESLGQAYCNEGTQFQSSGVLSSAMYRVLVQNNIPPEAKLDATVDINPSHIPTYAAKLLRSCKVEVLVAGNVSLDDCEVLFDQVEELLKETNSQWLSAVNVPKFKVIDIPVCEVIPSKDSWHALSGLIHPLEALEFKGHSVDLYFHIGENNLESRVVLQLIEHLMKEPLYREVRTKQQLGYMVKCSSVNLYGQLGFVIELTSGKHLPQQLAQDIDNFLLIFRATLREMKSQVFFDNLSALARKKLELKSFSQFVDQHWETIVESYSYKELTYQWNKVYEEIELLKNVMSLEMVLKYFDKWLLPTSNQRRRVSVVVFGSEHGINPLKELLNRKNYIKIINASEYQDPVGGAHAPICSIM